MALVDIRWNPSRKELRIFAVLLIGFFAVVEGLIAVRGWEVPAALVGGAGFVAGAAGFLFPSLLRPIYLVWILAAFPIGWLVSHLGMALVFYLCITPIGLLLRLLRGDPLDRRWDRQAETYWKSRRRDRDSSRYFRQF
jgi:hypothetical protein